MASKAPLRASVGELSCRHAKHGDMTEGAGSRNRFVVCIPAYSDTVTNSPHILSQPKTHRLPPPTPFGGHLPLHAVEGEAWVLPHQCFFWWYGPNTPGGVSLRVLLRQWEHGTMLAVGRSACGRPAHHLWWGLGRPRGSPLREKIQQVTRKSTGNPWISGAFSIFYRSRSRTSMAVSLALPKRSMKRLHLTRKA